MIQKIVATGIILLFMIISITPMVIGFDTKHTEHFFDI
jgi:hypothetical protein